MTDKYTKIVIWANLALTLGIVLFIASADKSSGNPALGAAGNMLAENYIPYVMYNGGYNSAKDFTISGVSSFTGNTELASTTITQLKVGASSTPMLGFRFGTCDLAGGNRSHAASTTVEYICSATGVAAADKIFINSATTSSSVVLGSGTLYMVGANATTTDQFGVGIYNDTGAAVTIAASTFSGFGSSTEWMALR